MIHLPILSKKGVVQSKFYAHTQCLKITENVSFNIASEASYVYILSGQKFIENAKNGPKPEASNATFEVIFKYCDYLLEI